MNEHTIFDHAPAALSRRDLIKGGALIVGPPHPLGLLRPYRQRPCRRHAAEEGDELSPSHLELPPGHTKYIPIFAPLVRAGCRRQTCRRQRCVGTGGDDPQRPFAFTARVRIDYTR